MGYYTIISVVFSQMYVCMYVSPIMFFFFYSVPIAKHLYTKIKCCSIKSFNGSLYCTKLNVQGYVDCHGKSNHPSKYFNGCSSTERAGRAESRGIDSTPIPETIGQLWHLDSTNRDVEDIHTTSVRIFNIGSSTSAG